MKIDFRATDVNFMRLQLYIEDCKEREKSAKQVDDALAGHGYFDTATDTATPTEAHTETEDEMYDRMADMEKAKHWERMEQQAEQDEAYQRMTMNRKRG